MLKMKKSLLVKLPIPRLFGNCLSNTFAACLPNSAANFAASLPIAAANLQWHFECPLQITYLKRFAACVESAAATLHYGFKGRLKILGGMKVLLIFFTNSCWRISGNLQNIGNALTSYDYVLKTNFEVQNLVKQSL